MKNFLIVSVNSKYIHSSLASWYIYTSAKENCIKDIRVFHTEGTINENEEMIFKRIISFSPLVVAFSCYVWNIKTVLSLCEKLKDYNENIKIVLGGPEVAFNKEEILKKHSFIDFISSGEGEENIPRLFNAIASGESYDFIEGSADLENMPSPYCEEYLETLKNRIAYIESSRGCPFRCAFCLSGKEGSVRYFPLEKVKENMILLSSKGAKTIKFVDRTFNCNKKRAIEILSFIRENYGNEIPEGTCFHFEIAADILDEETISLISSMPLGSVQFEVGIQSFNEETLSAINRKTNPKKLKENVLKLLNLKNCHIHIDLIAGLPKEDFKSFVTSFNEAYSLKANMLQLGFLKILHGSPMSEKRELFPCEYSSEPPYEVKNTPWITSEELSILHKCENELERLYNSGRFKRSLDYVLSEGEKTPFEVFLGMANFLDEKNEKGSIPLDKYTNLAFLYFSSLEGVKSEVLRDKMLLDRILTNNSDVIPESLKVKDERMKKVKSYFKALYPPEKGEKRTTAIIYSKNEAVLVRYLDENKNPVSGEYLLTKVLLCDTTH